MEDTSADPFGREGLVFRRAWFSRRKWMTLHANCTRMGGAWDDLVTVLREDEVRIVNGVTELWLARDVRVVKTGASSTN
jgi:hypothetical protein